jgi:hypothetical protein
MGSVVDFYTTRDYDIMSTTGPHEAAYTSDDLFPNLLFDFPGADIILRSQDSYHFRVPRIYIINSSRILCELIRSALEIPRAANDEPSLPVVQLPESGQIVHCLLTFIFPVTPLVPSTPDESMELLSVAQTYQMGITLTNIRETIALRNSLLTGSEPAFRIYHLAQKYGLRSEALQAARTIFPMTTEDLVDKVDITPGTLYELSKFHKRVRAILKSDLTEFKASHARGTLTGLRCLSSTSQFPRWLNRYIDSIGENPNLSDPAEFNILFTLHVKDLRGSKCACMTLPAQTIRDFWEASAAVVQGSFEKVNIVMWRAI